MIQLRYMLALGTLLVACIQSAVAQQPLRKPRIEDTIKANVYADNSFRLYINGELVAVDSIAFIPVFAEMLDGVGSKNSAELEVVLSTAVAAA